jgi:hypothetical protein
MLVNLRSYNKNITGFNQLLVIMTAKKIFMHRIDNQKIMGRKTSYYSVDNYKAIKVDIN